MSGWGPSSCPGAELPGARTPNPERQRMTTTFLSPAAVSTRLHSVLDRITAGEADQVDRLLAAAALVAGAVVLAWPSNRQAPAVIASAAGVARALYERRTWLVPQLADPIAAP